MLSALLNRARILLGVTAAYLRSKLGCTMKAGSYSFHFYVSKDLNASLLDRLNLPSNFL